MLPSQIHNLPGKTCTPLTKPGRMRKSSVSTSTSQPKPGVVAPARETKHINRCAVCKIMHRSAMSINAPTGLMLHVSVGHEGNRKKRI